ncbi:MAG: acyl--CoA ligase [Pseudomonadota bacterium]
MISTLRGLCAPHDDDTPALGAPGRDWLSYGALRALSQEVEEGLRGFGVSATDRVAIVLANGPDMASAFFTIAQAAATAPLNPAYRKEEFLFYLKDLGAKALVVSKDYDGPALAAGRQLGLLILHLTPRAAAGDFELAAERDVPLGEPAETVRPDADDMALILHTSGTTSRPKIVPLTQRNVASSAQNIAASLNLNPADRCLNVMPLFHIHGLVAAVSATFAAGGSIWCAPGFDALRFFSWMSEARPSWYTAVPTMHQAILSRAGRNAEVVADVPLRFLRSSSASLPAQVMEALQQTFGAPVIEAYGMTEAAHQMCCNPLALQKPGSVGVAAGPEVAIAHETRNEISSGTGEVVISGPNVTPGYESNPEANAKNFFEAQGKRWFRTGDQGALDADGYLHLTGRLKEIINRGGEKISPLEVDGVLLDHPAVQQVVTFALPHPKLGEEVAAALVLKDGQDADERAIRDFAATRMADFKVPRRVIILDELPKGATGKIQRIGMAEKLGLVTKA